MKLIKRSIVFLLPAFIYGIQSKAQMFDDWEARPSFSLEYEMNKGWSLTGTYYLYMDHKLKKYDKSEIGAEIKYKVSSWMDAGLEYRYGMKQAERAHDTRLYASFDYHPSKKWKLAYRIMGERESTSLMEGHEDYTGSNSVEYDLRNKITISYELTGDIELYLFTENYLQPEQGKLFFDKQKTGIGAEFEIANRSEIETRFEVRSKNNGKNNARINIGYTYTIGNQK